MKTKVKFYEHDNEPMQQQGKYAVAFNGCFGIESKFIERDGHPLDAQVYVDFPEAGGPTGATIIFSQPITEDEAAAFEEYFDEKFDDERMRMKLSGDAFLAYNESSLWNDYEKVLIAQGIDPAELDEEEDEEFLF